MSPRLNRLLLLLTLTLWGSFGAVHADDDGLLVGFAQDHLANDWRRAQVHKMEQLLAEHPAIKFVYTDAGGSTARQIRDIEDLVSAGVDILVTSPRDARAMTPVIAQAYRQGVAVILLTRRIKTDDFTSFVAPDDAAIARQAAHYLADQLDGKGKVLLLQGVPTATTTQQRTEAFLDELSNYPGLSIASIRVANFLRHDAIRAMEDVLDEGLAFDAIYAQSDSMASGARLAMLNRGIDPGNIPLVGIDYITEAREAIIRGVQRASFTYPTSAKEAVELILAITAGQTVPHHVDVPFVLVDEHNVDSIEPIF